jgi:hypothetical protein
MRTSGPLLTLLAVVGLAIGLLAANMTAHPKPTAAPDAPAGNAVAAAPLTFPQLAGYAGSTKGRATGEAAVQLAVRDGAAVAYLSDGKKLTSWLRGQVTGSSVTLRGTGTDVLTGALTDGAVSGDVTVGGKHWRFAAEPGAAPAAEKRLATGGNAPTGSTGNGSSTTGTGKTRPGTPATRKTGTPDTYTSPSATSIHQPDTAQAAGAGGW